MIDQTPPARPQPAAVALDAHFYSGGLQVRRLGGEPGNWTPEPPETYVGFRDELPLEPGDRVVEFTRLGFGERRLTWIAVFQRAPDAVLGDRKNHAGVGAWLLDQDVCAPGLLLHGLRQLSAKLVESGPEQTAAAAQGFLQPDYLPAYVQPIPALPPQLSGWSFAAQAMPATALFQATAASEDAAWQLVAEQLKRMTLLPGPTRDHSRALILVPSPPTRTVPVDSVATLQGNFSAELIERLPAALADLTQEAQQLREQSRAGQADAQALRRQLEGARAAEAEARSRVTELEQQVADSDVLQRLAAIDQGLRQIAGSTSRTEGALVKLNSNLHQRSLAPQPRYDGGGHETRRQSYAAESGRMEYAQPADQDDLFGMPAATVRMIAVALVVVVVVVAIAVMLWKRI